MKAGQVGFAAESREVQAREGSLDPPTAFQCFVCQIISACAASRDRSFLALCRTDSFKSSISVYELGAHATNRPVQVLEDL